MQLLREIYRLLQTWPKQDCIRIAPGIGKLMNLQPGRQLLIRQALFQIMQRTQTTGTETVAVIYQLLDVDQESCAQLSVAINLAPPISGMLTLTQHSSTIEIFYQDVTVLSTVAGMDVDHP